MARIGFAAGQAVCAKAERENAGIARAPMENCRKVRRLAVMLFSPKFVRARLMQASSPP
jgi:hypothetical protein